MTTERVAPPAVLAVSMAAVRQTMRQDDDSLDLTYTIAVKALTKDAEHITGRAFVNRPMRVTLDKFSDSIRLSAPTFSVESVKYIDVDGVLQTLDPADYYVDKITMPGYTIPAAGKSWPETMVHANAVTVDYTAGYGPDETTVPEDAQNYILVCLQIQFDPNSKVTKDDMCGLLDELTVYG